MAGSAGEDAHQVGIHVAQHIYASYHVFDWVFLITSLSGVHSVLQVLGIPKNADYNAIQRAYKKKISDALGNEVEISRIEAAHSSLMMSALTSRLQGNAPVDKNILYADRARYFPWRPRIFFAEKTVILYSGIAQAVLLAWALLSPVTAGTQPVVWCK